MYNGKLGVNLQMSNGHRVLQILMGTREFDLTNPTSHFLIFFSSFLPFKT